MSLVDFFSPIFSNGSSVRKEYLNSQLGKVIIPYTDEFPDIYAAEKKPDLAIVGVEEDRASVDNKGCAKGANEVRKHLYELYLTGKTVKFENGVNVSFFPTVSIFKVLPGNT